MARQKIFISYSHKDAKAREQLERFLKTLERQGVVDWWADNRLEGGDEWKAGIDRALEAATVAVLLISQDFLASSFIATEEVPRILTRHAAGELVVLPVFLSPSTVEQEEFRFIDPRTSEERKKKLDSFQGYGTPKKPLSELLRTDRDRVYTKLSNRLRELAQPADSATPKFRSAPAVSRRIVSSSPPAQSYELTVQLERRDEILEVTSFRSGGEQIASRRVPWEVAFDRTDGDAPFRLLLGTAAQWDPVLRAVFDRPAPAPRPNPVWAPLRVRIATEDGLLANQPWRLTSWSGRPLVESGWSFSTTQVIDPTRDLTTTAPANVLIVAPPESSHVVAVKDLLARVWPTGQEQRYVRVVVTRQQLEHALRGMKPHLVYVYGGGEMTGRQPALLLEGERLGLSRLARLFEEAEHWPAAVYLNMEGWSAAELPAVGSVLGAQVPVVIWRGLRERTPDSMTLALT